MQRAMPDSMAVVLDLDEAPPQMGPEIDLMGAVDQNAVQLAVDSGKRPWQQVWAERGALQPEDLDYTVLGTQRQEAESRKEGREFWRGSRVAFFFCSL